MTATSKRNSSNAKLTSTRRTRAKGAPVKKLGVKKVEHVSPETAKEREQLDELHRVKHLEDAPSWTVSTGGDFDGFDDILADTKHDVKKYTETDMRYTVAKVVIFFLLWALAAALYWR